MKNGDWTAYGKAQKELEDALNKAIELDMTPFKNFSRHLKYCSSKGAPVSLINTG